jgi:hypothetical protein
MARIYTTMRGRKIDMSALAAANADKIAAGNAKITARGDILGPNGVVLRTQEQVEQEWLRNQQRQNEVAGVSNNIKAPLFPDKPIVAAMLDDQNFDPMAETLIPTPVTHTDNAEQVKKVVQQRRKITESDQ